MKQNTKDWMQYLSALGLLASAIIAALWSFAALSEIHATVLTYVGEAVAFCAAVFGLALYAKNEIRKEFRRMNKNNEFEQSDGN